MRPPHPRRPSSQGAGKPVACTCASGFEFQSAVKTVANPSGTDAAWSKEMLAGICCGVSLATSGGDELSEAYLCDFARWEGEVFLERRAVDVEPAIE